VPGSRRAVVAAGAPGPGRVPGRLPWSGPPGWRAVVRAGWLARHALVQGGRRPVGNDAFRCNLSLS